MECMIKALSEYRRMYYPVPDFNASQLKEANLFLAATKRQELCYCFQFLEQFSKDSYISLGLLGSRHLSGIQSTDLLGKMPMRGKREQGQNWQGQPSDLM